MMKLLKQLGLLGMVTFSLSSCKGLGDVQPWEKGHLAKPEMTFERDALDSAYAEHIYFSKEASSGGNGVGGGGCGCN